MKRSLFDEGFLHLSQFLQLEMLQDRDNPNFVREVFRLYFEDMSRQFSEIEQILQKELIGKQRHDMNRFLHRLKGSVVRIMAAFEMVKEESENLKLKLEPYFQLMGQIGSSTVSEAPK
ncbi:hypothetical protein VNO77_32930 [Canavalia gladiata]|uniref:Histidine-containing phosphotransfer protein n=1 Tax=Canavalia gladiata TaxID=3824 RepID=A0AAN9KCX8_CANGL